VPQCRVRSSVRTVRRSRTPPYSSPTPRPVSAGKLTPVPTVDSSSSTSPSGGRTVSNVRAIGFAPAERAGLFLSLGQRVTSDFGLAPAALQLEPLTVRAESDPRLNASRTGPALAVPGATIVRLPVDKRDFTGLALLSPQVTPSANGGISFAGQHDRLNSVLVDGTTDNNVKGFKDGVFGIPGDESSFGLLTLVPEAVQALQVSQRRSMSGMGVSPEGC
jgi:hypothetical protein